MNQNISTLMVMVLVGTATFLGMFSFMDDMNRSGYDISLPSEMESDFDSLNTDMNKTATDITDTLSGDQSWLETAFNVVFRLPQNVISIIESMANSGTGLLGAATGEDMENLPMPSWITTVVLVFIAIIIATTIFYVVMGRRV